MKKNIVDIIRRYVSNIYSTGDAKHIINTAEQKNTLDLFESDMDREWIRMTQDNDAEMMQNMQEVFTIIKKTQENDKRNRFSITTFSKYAAACILIIGLSIYSYINIFTPDSHKTYAHTEQTTTGEKKLITLPDGSQVNLNASTKIEYYEDTKYETRNLIVEGEVFLDVTKNPKKPFIVQTPKSKITVLGTAFNVKAYKEDDILTVSVESGRVNVEIDNGSALLTQDQQLILEQSTGLFIKRRENANRVKSWIEGNLYFNKTPLKQVIRELERIYKCKIELQEEYDDFIYGEHENESIEEVLKSLKYTTGLKHKINDEKIILYK